MYICKNLYTYTYIGIFDCQPVVYDTCRATQVRTLDGKCVASGGYCVTVCGAAGGVFGTTTGTCECNDITPLSQICDATCRASVPTMKCDRASGNIVLTEGGVSSVVALRCVCIYVYIFTHYR